MDSENNSSEYDDSVADPDYMYEEDDGDSSTSEEYNVMEEYHDDISVVDSGYMFEEDDGDKSISEKYTSNVMENSGNDQISVKGSSGNARHEIKVKRRGCIKTRM